MNEDENVIWRGFEARIERLEDLIHELDELLRGSRKSKHSGIVADQERMELELRKLNAVVFVDSTGKRGIAHDVDYLMDRKSGAERREGFKWTFWGLILATLISSLSAILPNLDKIKNLWTKTPPFPWETRIVRVKHKKIYRVRVVPEQTPSDDTKESQPSQ